MLLNVEAEQHDVAVLDDVLFAFGADEALFLAGSHVIWIFIYLVDKQLLTDREIRFHYLIERY